MQKEHLSTFKAAPWKRPEELEGFVQEVGPLLPPDLLKLLEIVSHKASSADPLKHRMRCGAFGRMASPVTHKGLFKPYLEALKTHDAVLRQTLIALIPRVNNIHEHPELCSFLKSAEPELRATGALVLKKVGGKTVFELLAQLIEQPGFPGRQEAMDVLVNTAGHHAIPALHMVVVHGSPQEKAQALRYLGDERFMAKDPEGALGAIAAALPDPNEQVLLQAIAAFSAHCGEDDWFLQIAPALDAPALRVVEAAVRGIRRFGSPRAIGALERMIRTGPNAIRFAALETLEGIGSEEVLPAVITALSHRQIIVRTRAGEVLSRLSQSGKVDLSRTVVWLLRSRDENVRRMAVELAKTVQDPDGNLWPKLLGYLRDEDWWVRERVVDALVEMAGGKLTRHMVGYLADPSDVVRRYAVDVLSRVRDPQALGALVRTASADSDWWVRERAVEAVASLADPRSIPYLVDLLERDPEMRFACLQALSLLGARQAAPQIAALLADPDPDLRLSALAALAKLNDPGQVEAVRPLLGDRSARIRAAAQRLLAHWQIAFDLKGGGAPEPGISVLDRMLIAMARTEADDLVLASGRRPMVKKLGKMIPLSEAVISEEQMRAILYPQLAPEQVADLQALKEVDISYEVKGEALRFRVNVFMQACGLSAVLRIIKGTLPEFEKLGLPPIVQTFGNLKNGLVLVGGPTGSGKSTTLAALMDYINRTSGRHIISLEDPIEVLHARKRSLVNQREIGTHTRSFSAALRSTLRQDPDVILVGEMRDLPTISFAVTAAETGHLVFGTVHTVSADTTVDRLINTFPSGQQEQVRNMLSESLRAVACQYLLKRKDEGRALAMEIMVNSDAISALIRKGKTFQIQSVVATSAEQGMQAMDNELLRLHREGLVSADEAFMKAREKKDFEALVKAEAESQRKPAVAAVPLARAS